MFCFCLVFFFFHFSMYWSISSVVHFHSVKVNYIHIQRVKFKNFNTFSVLVQRCWENARKSFFFKYCSHQCCCCCWYNVQASPDTFRSIEVVLHKFSPPLFTASFRMKNSLDCVLSNFQRVRTISFEWILNAFGVFKRISSSILLCVCLSLFLCMYVYACGWERQWH